MISVELEIIIKRYVLTASEGLRKRVRLAREEPLDSPRPPPLHKTGGRGNKWRFKKFAWNWKNISQKATTIIYLLYNNLLWFSYQNCRPHNFGTDDRLQSEICDRTHLGGSGDICLPGKFCILKNVRNGYFLHFESTFKWNLKILYHTIFNQQ